MLSKSSWGKRIVLQHREMAMIIRCCSCYFTRPCSFPSPPPPSDLISSGKTHFTGNSQVFNVEKFRSSSGGAGSVQFVFRCESPGDGHLHRMPKSEGQAGVIQMPPRCKFFQTILCSSGTMGQEQLKSAGLAFLIANALIWNTPFEALAETCEADNSIVNMPLLLFVALVGATVGGLLARQRKGELKRLNEQLRQINAALRRQAKIESYAPSLSYAPVGSRLVENEVIVDPRKEELISRLKAGKNFLRNQDLERAFEEFKAALQLAQDLKDPTEEKKAARGLGASLQRQGKHREAIKYHSMVLAISSREGEDSGTTEAYGAIADCYTELGDLEQAAKFYDKYIAGLETD